MGIGKMNLVALFHGNRSRISRTKQINATTWILGRKNGKNEGRSVIGELRVALLAVVWAFVGSGLQKQQNDDEGPVMDFNILRRLGLHLL